MVSSELKSLMVIAVSMLVGVSKSDIKNCVRLGPTVNDVETCAVCDAGYWGGQSSTSCTLCTFGCVNCNSVGICQSCIKSLYLSNGVCVSCGVSCSECLGHTCNKCASGFSLNSNSICVSCPENCEYCEDMNKCQRCSEGYYLTNETNRATNSSPCEPLTPSFISNGALAAIIICSLCCVFFILGCVVCFKRDAEEQGPSYESRGLNKNPFLQLDNQPVDTKYINPQQGFYSYY